MDSISQKGYISTPPIIGKATSVPLQFCSKAMLAPLIRQ